MQVRSDSAHVGVGEIRPTQTLGAPFLRDLYAKVGTNLNRLLLRYCHSCSEDSGDIFVRAGLTFPGFAAS